MAYKGYGILIMPKRYGAAVAALWRSYLNVADNINRYVCLIERHAM